LKVRLAHVPFAACLAPGADSRREVKALDQRSATPGSFSASAKKAGMSTHAFAEKHKHSLGTVGKRARLALTLSKLRPK
jgi:hypothetical protein